MVVKLLDAKLYALQNSADQQPSALDLFKNYIFSRHSSAVRIPINTLAAGVIASFFGMAKAIYLDTPKGSTTLIHGAGALAMGVVYFSTHEIANGIVRRSLGKEQLFLSNTAAAIVTNIATFAFLNRNSRVLLKSNFLRSVKYSWTFCLFAMSSDLYFVQVRHYLLRHGLSMDKKEFFKINRIPSEGKRWLEMKRIEKLREEANVQRFGTDQPMDIFSPKKQTMTFEQLKEQIKQHQAYLKEHGELPKQE